MTPEIMWRSSVSSTPALSGDRIDALRRTLEDAGVIFIDAGEYAGIGGPGVRLKGEPVARDVILDLETTAAQTPPLAQTARSDRQTRLTRPD